MKTQNVQTPRLLVLLALGWLASSPMAEAVSPPPDGGYPGGNTAEGYSALLSLTDNTAIGAVALFDNTTGARNTATGVSALHNNTAGDFNTANGALALSSNTEGHNNTASGNGALQSNATGNFNTAIGDGALFSNTTGDVNAAIGTDALADNTRQLQCRRRWWRTLSQHQRRLQHGCGLGGR
jgi:hypothetical protein